MKKHLYTVILAVCITQLFILSAQAVRFDPLFRVVGIQGECLVKPPKASDFFPAVEDRAYPYGTKLRTGHSSSAIIRFSNGNDCRILSNARATIIQDAKDKKLKTVQLHEGKAIVELDKDFHESTTDALNIETPAAICGAIGCKFEVSSSIDHSLGLNLVVIRILEGTISVFGPNFEIPLMKEKETLSVNCTLNGDFTRLKPIKGSLETNLTDPDGNRKVISMHKQSSVKLWRTRSVVEDNLVIAIAIVDPTGKILETYAYTEETEESAMPKKISDNTDQ